MIIGFFVDKALRNFHYNSTAEVWWDRQGSESGPERGGPASASEDVTTKQDYTPLERVKIWLLCSELEKIPIALIWMLFWRVHKLFSFFTGLIMEKNTSIFLVQQRKLPLPFFWLNAVTAANFPVNDCFCR